MKAQIIENHGKKEFAVIPYKDYLRMQEDLEDYHDLRELRKAKLDPKNKQGRSFDVVAAELGLTQKKPNKSLKLTAKSAAA
jgi:hypothetical protein